MPIFKSSLEYIDVVKAYAAKNKNSIEKVMSAKEFDDFNLQLNNYIEGIHFFADREEAYNATLEECYKNLYEMRANAVCLRCSGNFGDWYDAKKNYIVTSANTC
jgi:hypothetical protein